MRRPVASIAVALAALATAPAQAADYRLDYPWMMCSAPEDGEHHYFGEVPLRIVFNSEDVGRIYDAYGKNCA